MLLQAQPINLKNWTMQFLEDWLARVPQITPYCILLTEFWNFLYNYFSCDFGYISWKNTLRPVPSFLFHRNGLLYANVSEAIYILLKQIGLAKCNVDREHVNFIWDPLYF